METLEGVLRESKARFFSGRFVPGGLLASMRASEEMGGLQTAPGRMGGALLRAGRGGAGHAEHREARRVCRGDAAASHHRVQHHQLRPTKLSLGPHARVSFYFFCDQRSCSQNNNDLEFCMIKTRCFLCTKC
jgi:hypothetical protein